MVSLRGLGRWQRWSKPVAPVTLLVAPKQCPDPTTTEQNKIWGWTNSCRISGSFIQIAHFPCFFLSLSPPPLDPRGRPHSQFKEERGRDKQTNRGRDWVANMEELWHSWKGERERERERERKKQLYWEWLWEGSCGQVWLSPLCLTDTRWQRFAAQLLSRPPILRSVIDSLLLNNRPSRVQCIYVTVCIWLVWERVVVVMVVEEEEEEEERGTGWGAANPPWSPPSTLSPSLHLPSSHSCSPLWAPALWSWRCWIRRSHRGGNLAYLCGILLFSTIWIMMAPTLLPSLFLLSTLSRKHRLSSHSLVCLCAALLPSLPCAASPLLITPINIFNFCHFSPCVLSSPLSVSLFSST